MLAPMDGSLCFSLAEVIEFLDQLVQECIYGLRAGPLRF